MEVRYIEDGEVKVGEAIVLDQKDRWIGGGRSGMRRQSVGSRYKLRLPNGTVETRRDDEIPGSDEYLEGCIDLQIKDVITAIRLKVRSQGLEANLEFLSRLNKMLNDML